MSRLLTLRDRRGMFVFKRMQLRTEGTQMDESPEMDVGDGTLSGEFQAEREWARFGSGCVTQSLGTKAPDWK